MSTQSETVTVRLSPEAKARLDELATQTRRTKSFLAAEAISDYVEREMKIVAAIHRGLEDVKAGRTVPHDVAIERLHAAIERGTKKRG